MVSQKSLVKLNTTPDLIVQSVLIKGKQPIKVKKVMFYYIDYTTFFTRS